MSISTADAAVNARTDVDGVSLARALAIRAGLPLVLGAATYLVRQRSQPSLVREAGLSDLVAHVQSGLAPLARLLPVALLGSAPDAAWAFATGSVVSLLWSSRSASRTGWIAAGALVAVGYEVAQLVALVPGTFDVIDLVASAMAYALAVVVNRKQETWTST